MGDRFELGPATSVGDTDRTSQILSTNLQMEQATLLLRSDRNFDIIGTGLLHIDRVIQPLPRVGPTDTVPVRGVVSFFDINLRILAVVSALILRIIVLVSDTGRTFVVVFSLDLPAVLVRVTNERINDSLTEGPFFAPPAFDSNSLQINGTSFRIVAYRIAAQVRPGSSTLIVPTSL